MNNANTEALPEAFRAKTVQGGNIEALFERRYAVEDAPDKFNPEKFLRDYEKAKKQGRQSKNKLADEPESHCISIPKTEIRKLFDISDAVVEGEPPKPSSQPTKNTISSFISEGKRLPSNIKVGFLDFCMVNDNKLFVRFHNNINFVIMKLPVSSKDISTRHFAFFKNDLKAYAFSSEGDNFIIQEYNERYRACLFDKYVCVKTAVVDEKQSDFLFSDPMQYEYKCSVDAAAMRQILRPIARIIERKLKNKKHSLISRVCFQDNHVVISDSDLTRFIQQYPNNMSFPDCTLNTSFVKIFSMLLPDDYKEEIQISVSPEAGIKAATDDFEVSGPLYCNGTFIERELMEILKKSEFTKISGHRLRGISGYSCYIRLSKKLIRFDYEDNGLVKCDVLHSDENKEYKYTFHLNEDKQSHISPLVEPPIIYAPSLKWVLKGFENDDNLEILMRSELVALKSGNSYAVLYSKSYDA